MRFESRKYFSDDGTGHSVCKICKAKLAGRRSSNMKRHLKALHQLDFGLKKDGSACNTESKSVSKQYRKRNTNINICKERLLSCYFGLVTEDNIPLALLNSTNLRCIIEPICRTVQNNTGKRIQLNLKTCKNALRLVAEDVRKSITNELKHHLLAIKVFASKRDPDYTFVICCQFFKEDTIRSVTLGLVKMDAYKNTNRLTAETFDILSRYDINLNQVLSITIDNESELNLSNITTAFENTSGVPLTNIQIYRCATRTAHLCWRDVLNADEIQKHLNICRNVTRFINESARCREAFESNALCLPQLDSETQWGSTYSMVAALQSAKAILLNSALVPKEEHCAASSFWEFVDSFVEAVGPLRRTIKRYEEEDIHYSHYYAHWLKCKLSTECIVQNNACDADTSFKYKIGTLVLARMQQREISNECLHACLYLDPRFHRMLNPIQRTEAIHFLKKLWDKTCLLKPEDTVLSNNNPINVANVDSEDQLLDNFLSQSMHYKPTSANSVTAYSKIDCLQLPFMKSDTNVLMFWKDRRSIDSELYQLSNACYAIPATQIISPENSSALMQVLQSNPDCSKDTLENIIVIKLNCTHWDKKATTSSAALLETSDEEKSNDPLLVLEDAAYTWSDLDKSNEHMTDDDEKDADISLNTGEESYMSFNVKEEVGFVNNLETTKNLVLCEKKIETVNKISIKSEDLKNTANLQISREIMGEIPGKSADHDAPIKPSKPVPKRRRESLCVECGKKFVNPYSLQTHMLRHRGNMKFKCPHCPKAFVCYSGLYTHKKIHQPEKSFVCHVCGRAFRTKYELKAHHRCHIGKKNVQCEYCEQRFITRDHQRRHMRTHTGEKPYRCKFCDRAYAQSNDLNKHLKQHLGDNVYQCDLCPVRLPLLRDLRAHFATHKDEDEETRARNLKAREEEERNLLQKLRSI